MLTELTSLADAETITIQCDNKGFSCKDIQTMVDSIEKGTKISVHGLDAQLLQLFKNHAVDITDVEHIVSHGGIYDVITQGPRGLRIANLVVECATKYPVDCIQPDLLDFLNIESLYLKGDMLFNPQTCKGIEKLKSLTIQRSSMTKEELQQMGIWLKNSLIQLEELRIFVNEPGVFGDMVDAICSINPRNSKVRGIELSAQGVVSADAMSRLIEFAHKKLNVLYLKVHGGFQVDEKDSSDVTKCVVDWCLDPNGVLQVLYLPKCFDSNLESIQKALVGSVHTYHIEELCMGEYSFTHAMKVLRNRREAMAARG